MILMENSLGTGENANGKESLFKCLPEKGVVAERYWENENHLHADVATGFLMRRDWQKKAIICISNLNKYL